MAGEIDISLQYIFFIQSPLRITWKVKEWVIYLSNNLPDFERLKSSFWCHRVNLNHVWSTLSFVPLNKQQILLLVKMRKWDNFASFGVVRNRYSQIIRHIKHGIHTVRWVTYHLFDVGLKTGWGSTSKFFVVLKFLSNPFPTLMPFQPPTLYTTPSLISRLVEFSNVTEYVICIFTLSSSAHTTKRWRDVYIQQGLFLPRTKWSKGENIHCAAEKSAHNIYYIYSYIKGKNQTWKDGFCVLSFCCFCDISKRKIDR